MFRQSVLFLSLILILVSCSGSPSVELPEKVAALENLTVISASVVDIPRLNSQREAGFGDTEEVIIGRMGSVAVDDAGRVYIADGNRQVIHVYEPDGTHLTEIGGEGDGPGEFRRISSIQPHGDYLHVMDGSALRISRFRMVDFRFADDVSVPYESNATGGYIQYPSTFSVLETDKYLIHFGVGYSSGEDSGEKPMIAGRILNRIEGGYDESTVYEFPANETLIKREGTSLYMMGTQYKRTSHVVVNGGNTLIYGWTDDLLFKMHDTDGNYRQALFVPYEKPRLNRNEVLSEYADRDEPWRGMVRNDNMPDTWPAFNTMLADDQGRIWASLFTDDKETYTWMVFDPATGQASGSTVRPRQWSVVDVKDGYLYARETDEETGLMEVVKYGFRFSIES